jgi:predicted secreted protein
LELLDMLGETEHSLQRCSNDGAERRRDRLALLEQREGADRELDVVVDAMRHLARRKKHAFQPRLMEQQRFLGELRALRSMA